MSKRSRDDYDDRDFDRDRDFGGSSRARSGHGGPSGRSHPDKQIGKRFAGQVTCVIRSGCGVIDGDVFVHKDYWPPMHKDNVREGDTFEVTLCEYDSSRPNREGYKFFGKIVEKIVPTSKHREREGNRHHPSLQGSRGESSSRASPPPGRKRRRESDEDDRHVRKDESRREEGGGSQRRQGAAAYGELFSSKKENGRWFRGKVTDILGNGGGEIEGDIFVVPQRFISDENLQKTQCKIQWRDCGVRIGDVVRVLLKEHTGRDRRFEWFADQVSLLERTSQESISRDSLAEERRSAEERRRRHSNESDRGEERRSAEERRRRHSNESDRGEERHRYSNESNRGEGRSYGPVIEGSGDHDTPRKRSSSRWDQGSNSRESSGLGISVVEGDVGGGGGGGGDGVDPRLRLPVLSRDNSLMSQDRESPITPSSAGGAGADMPPRDPRLPLAAAAAAAPTSVDLGAGNGTPDISSEQRSPVESVAKYALAPAKELTWADLSSVTMTPIDPPDYSVFPQAWNEGLAYKQQVFDVSFRHVMGDIQLVMEALGSLKGGQIEVKARIRNEAVESKFTRQLSTRDDIVTCLVLSTDGSASIGGFQSYLEQCQKCAYVELSDRCHALVMPSGTPLHKALVPGVKHPAVIAWVHDDKEGMDGK